MPLGPVQINKELAGQILDLLGNKVKDDSQAHAMEHSIEVQIPFLQALKADINIVPICVSHKSYEACDEIGQALAKVVQEYDKKVLLVASTAQAKDQLAIDRILALDPEGLYNTVSQQGISMCGVMPTTMVLTACKALGATNAEMVQYATSGDITGDYTQVVAYAGFIIH